MAIAEGGNCTRKDEKRRVREEMKRLRTLIPTAQRRVWDQEAADRLLKQPLILHADTVCCYISYGTETDTRGLIEELLSRGKRVACPRVDCASHDMDFYEISSLQDTVSGYMGIPEPAMWCERFRDENAVIVTPGLAFTQNGDRIGYGGGYYDRFFARRPGHRTVALAYPFQILPVLPTEPSDCRVDMIITPELCIVNRKGIAEHGDE